MFARLKILLWLLCWSSVIGRAASLPNVHERVAVYLKVDAIQSPTLLRSMQVELDRIMGEVRRDIVWWNPTVPGTYTDSQLVVITAKGNCNAPGVDDVDRVPTDKLALASTQEIHGRILPFITVYCDRLNSFLALALRDDPSHQQQRQGQAIARLVAHELYHFLAQTHEHIDGGVTQRGITASELLSTEFRFNHEASSELLAPLLARRVDPALAHESQ
jgi:hypothetical protein